jgi:hypothetical protein
MDPAPNIPNPGKKSIWPFAALGFGIAAAIASSVYIYLHLDTFIGLIPVYGFCYEKSKAIKTETDKDIAALSQVTILSGQATRAGGL